MISVVIPLYNKQESIVATLQSVLAQTYQNFEIVVVDDGSTDNSCNIVEQFIIENNCSNICLHRKSNGGVSSARNEGIRQAKGEYIAFLDADDYWEPEYLETQSKMIQDFPEAKMWGTAWGKTYRDIKIDQKGINVKDDFRGIILSNEYYSNQMYLFCTDVVVLDKQIFEEIDMFDERIGCGEDLDLWWRIILHYPVAYDNQCLAYYRWDAENRITMSKPKLEKHFINYIEKYELYYDKCPAFKKYLQHSVLGHLYIYYREDSSNKDVRRILKQIDFSLQPFSYRLRYKLPRLYEWLLKFKRK